MIGTLLMPGCLLTLNIFCVVDVGEGVVTKEKREYAVAKRAVSALAGVVKQALTLAMLLTITCSFQDHHAHLLHESLSHMFRLSNFTKYDPKVSVSITVCTRSNNCKLAENGIFIYMIKSDFCTYFCVISSKKYKEM